MFRALVVSAVSFEERLYPPTDLLRVLFLASVSDVVLMILQRDQRLIDQLKIRR